MFTVACLCLYSIVSNYHEIVPFISFFKIENQLRITFKIIKQKIVSNASCENDVFFYKYLWFSHFYTITWLSNSQYLVWMKSINIHSLVTNKQVPFYHNVRYLIILYFNVHSYLSFIRAYIRYENLDKQW